MGKGTIIRHLGEGQYRVRLNRSTARIDASLARITTDLSVLQQRIETAWQELQDTESRLADAIGEINAAIAAISDRIQDLADALREARELVDQRTDELRTVQESLDYLEQAKKDDPDSVTDEQIRIATEQRDAKQALLDTANDQLTTATDAWNARDVDVKDQDAKILEAASYPAPNPVSVTRPMVAWIGLRRLVAEACGFGSMDQRHAHQPLFMRSVSWAMTGTATPAGTTGEKFRWSFTSTSLTIFPARTRSRPRLSAPIRSPGRAGRKRAPAGERSRRADRHHRLRSSEKRTTRAPAASVPPR
jgi:uncharacterized phage infection (PIP) family protein YhgE